MIKCSSIGCDNVARYILTTDINRKVTKFICLEHEPAVIFTLRLIEVSFIESDLTTTTIETHNIHTAFWRKINKTKTIGRRTDNAIPK